MTRAGSWSDIPADMVRSPDWPMYRQRFLDYITETAVSVDDLTRRLGGFHRDIARVGLRSVDVAGVTYDVTPPQAEPPAEPPPTVGPSAWPWTTDTGRRLAEAAEAAQTGARRWDTVRYDVYGEMLCGPHPDGDLALALDRWCEAEANRTCCPAGYPWLPSGRCAGGLHVRGDHAS